MMFAIGHLELVVLLAAVGAAGVTLFLFVFSSRFASQPCVIGLGLAPLVIYFGAFIFLSLFNPAVLGVLTLWEGLGVMLLFVAPNYFAAFAVSTVALLKSRFSAQVPKSKWNLCPTLLLVHFLGLSWTYMLSSRL